MKQAIEYNLAGSARNDANEVVHFTLQGDKDEMSDSPSFIIAMPPRSITVFTIKRESCWPLSSCAGRSQESLTTRWRGRAPRASPGDRAVSQQGRLAKRPTAGSTASSAPEAARYGDAGSGHKAVGPAPQSVPRCAGRSTSTRTVT